ncbi:MAG: DUF4430 domain-containing protein [Clostridia bacterium]|nr:DUF4430 domain-containing protein [Clostridia bacterium]
MKKFFSIFLIFSFVFLLSSCGLTVTETDNTSTQNSATTTTKSTTIFTTEKQKETTTTTTKTSKTAKAETTEKSENSTSKPTEKKTTAKKTITCTLEISCENILKNIENLNENKLPFVPKNGYILKAKKVSVPEGSTAFDVIKKGCSESTCTDNCNFCKKDGIHLDFVYTPGYDSNYIRGIHQLYEKDCGTQSGWMYCVNGEFPNYGSSQYKVKNGDKISLCYTCDMGEDLGAIA